MIPKPVDKITLADLQALVGVVREGKTIEFKREMPAKSNEEIVKFLAAVSSLANSAGGDLLIGVDAKAGIATSIPGVSFPNLDDEKLRLEQLLANGVEPRLPRVDIEAVDAGVGHHVLIIRVHRSWLAPHRVTRNDKFYGRNSAGKNPLDVSELRSAFVLSETVTERIRKFRNDRLIKITAGYPPLPLHPGAVMAIHVVPFSTFAAGSAVDIVQSISTGTAMALPPGRSMHGNNYTVNLDGFVTFTNPPNQPAHAYAQTLRSGAIEGVEVLGTDDAGAPYLVGILFENTIIAALRNYLHFLKTIDMGYPIFVFLSFCGMNGCHLRTRDGGGGYYNGIAFREDVIALPEVMLQSETDNIPLAMRLSFNTIWNAFGHAQSVSYNSQGQWIGTA